MTESAHTETSARPREPELRRARSQAGTRAGESAVGIWRFITIVLVALSLGMTFGHVLEMPVKLGYSPEHYATLNNSLYRLYGTVGAVIEIGGVAATLILAAFVRHRRPAFGWSIAAAVLAVLALLIWCVVVFPINQANAAALRSGGTEASIMLWNGYRIRWEIGHAASAALHLLALGCLLISVLAETETPIWRRRAAGIG